MYSAAGLDVVGLRKAFNGRVVLDSASFHARCGEFVVILGSSGAGKTTLLRCIAGLTTPDAGAVSLNGVDLLQLHGRARRQVGVVFQQFNLVRRLSALENVLAGRLGYVPAWRGWLRQFARADVLCALECLEQVGLLAQAEQRADTLSGGQQQRVAIARILAQRPALILADEPVASLDPQTSMGIIELLRQIGRQYGSVVVCNLHQAHLAQTYADRIVGLAQGCLAVNVTAAEFDRATFTQLYGALGRADA